MNEESLRYRSSPLAAWFLLLSVAAVVAAFLPAGVAARPATEPILIGGVSLAILFPLIGAFFSPYLRNAAVGFGIGALMGGIGGLLWSTPTAHLSVPIFSTLAGSLAIIAVGLIGRSVR
jgi:hypothetical protein